MLAVDRLLSVACGAGREWMFPETDEFQARSTSWLLCVFASTAARVGTAYSLPPVLVIERLRPVVLPSGRGGKRHP